MKKKNDFKENILYPLWAIILYLFGKKPSSSTFIDEDTITCGYGRLDSIGCFKYPLSTSYIKFHHNGCTTWSEWKKTIEK